MAQTGADAGTRGGPLAQPRISSFATIDSTNDEARRRAEAGEPEGAVIVAASQTKGRGRRGRTWISPPGNLHCSILLRPHCDVADAANLSFVAALALAEALDGPAGNSERITVKWPNDVLLDHRKVAGILLESESAEGALQWVVIGIGVDVEYFPTGVDFPAISLRAAGCRADSDSVRDAVLRRFWVWYARWMSEGFAPVRDEWLARAAALGETIAVRLQDETIEGVFAGLDGDGALLLDVAGGRRRITAGDVFFPGRAGNGSGVTGTGEV